VREAEGVLAREVGAVGSDQLLLDEGDELRGDGHVAALAEQLGHGPHVEAAALDRRVLEHAALVRLEPVDPRGEHRVDGGGQLAVPVLSSHDRELLEEERVALGRLHDPARRVRSERLSPGAVHELPRLRVRERVQPEERPIRQ
jgi:hypothetical protein